MSCAEVERLRHQAHQLNKLLTEQRQRARASAALDRGGHEPGRSDYEALLQRKVSALAVRIEKHIAEHKCQD
jgi:hypothetical protein